MIKNKHTHLLPAVLLISCTSLQSIKAQDFTTIPEIGSPPSFEVVSLPDFDEPRIVSINHDSQSNMYVLVNTTSEEFEPSYELVKYDENLDKQWSRVIHGGQPNYEGRYNRSVELSLDESYLMVQGEVGDSVRVGDQLVLKDGEAEIGYQSYVLALSTADGDVRLLESVAADLLYSVVPSQDDKYAMCYKTKDSFQFGGEDFGYGNETQSAFITMIKNLNGDTVSVKQLNCDYAHGAYLDVDQQETFWLNVNVLGEFSISGMEAADGENDQKMRNVLIHLNSIGDWMGHQILTSSESIVTSTFQLMSDGKIRLVQSKFQPEPMEVMGEMIEDDASGLHLLMLNADMSKNSHQIIRHKTRPIQTCRNFFQLGEELLLTDYVTGHMTIGSTEINVGDQTDTAAAIMTAINPEGEINWLVPINKKDVGLLPYFRFEDVFQLANGDVYFHHMSPTSRSKIGDEEVELNRQSSVLIRFADYEAVTSTEYANENMQVYPNPATDYLHWQFDAPATKYTLTNLQGQVIKESPVSGMNKGRVSLAGISKGTYIVSIYTEEGVFTDKVFVTRSSN